MNSLKANESGNLQNPVSQTVRKTDRFDAFLSHNSLDKPDVELIRAKLEAAGIKIWIDRSELSGGDSLPTTLKRALQNSAACIVFIGRHGAGPWQEKEIAAANKLKLPKRRIIPVFLPGALRELPQLLKDRELLWLEFSDFEDQLALERLTRDIRTKVRHFGRWDLIRRLLIVVGVCLPILALTWGTKEFNTFEARIDRRPFEQRQEITIERRFDPRPEAWRFRQGTGIFADDLDATALDQVTARLKLNFGTSPDWLPLIPLLNEKRRGLAEIEWLDRPQISTPTQFLSREDAIGWGRAAPETVLEAFISLLDNQDIAVRSRATESLTRLGVRDKFLIQSLVALLKAEPEDVRVRATDSVRLLIQLGEGDAELAKTLVPLLADRDKCPSYFAAECLEKLGGSDDVEALIPLLKDKSIDVRDQATWAFGRLVERDMPIGESLIALLRDPDSDMRSRAVQFLGAKAAGNKHLVDDILRLLHDKDDRVRTSAATSLGTCKTLDPLLVDKLAGLIKDKAWFVGPAAKESLLRLGRGGTKVTGSLIPLLEDDDENVRYDTAELLGEIGDDNAKVTAALAPLLRDKEARVRFQAANSMVLLGVSDNSTVDVLIPFLAADNFYFRERAIKAMGQVKDADVQAASALIPLLEDEMGGIRCLAADSLARLGKKNDALVRLTVSDLENLVRTSPLWKHDQSVSESLLKSTKDKNKDIRWNAADCLGQMGNSDSRVIQALVALLKDEDSGVQFVAAKSLGELGNTDEGVLNGLVALLKSQDSTLSDQAAKSLAQLGKSDKSVLEALIATLAHESFESQAIALEALFQLGNSEATAVDALVAMLTSKEEFIRQRAVKALELFVRSGMSDARVINVLVDNVKNHTRDLGFVAADSLVRIGKSDMTVIKAVVPLLRAQDPWTCGQAIRIYGTLAQYYDKRTDDETLKDLESNDSLARERAGIVLAYRHQKVADNLPRAEVVDRIRMLRNDDRRWVRQASLHALYHIENRKVEVNAQADSGDK